MIKYSAKGFAKAHQILTMLGAAMFVMAWSNPATALNFLGPKYQVQISIDEVPALERHLQQFTRDQQGSNEQLKSLDNQSQYAKLLSSLLRKQLKALGYYDYGLSSNSAKDSIRFIIQPGQRAIINSVKVSYPEFIKEDLTELIKTPLLVKGAPLLTKEVLDAEQRLIEHLQISYCFVEPSLNKVITLDSRTKNADVYFNLETEPGRNLVSISFSGNQTLSSEFLANTIQIPKGCFSRRAINQAQIDLLETGLLTAAVPKITLLDESLVGVEFEVTERKHRTQSLGIGYSSDEGARFNLGWEHRNWRGNGKRLTSKFQISQISTQLDTSLRVPQFRRPDLALLLEGELANTRLDTFDTVSAQVSAILEYDFSQNWLFSIGATSEYARVQSASQDSIFRLLSFPFSARHDTSNSLLDPTKGHIWTFVFQPYTDLVDRTIQFNQIATTLRFYASPFVFQTQTKPTITLAGRVAVGTITGENLQQIPADERFYVGGGGSVRGFDYQSLSPADGNGVSGGLSFVETALEMRWRITSKWGASLFADAGRGFTDPSPDLAQRLSVGGGFGVRYMTSFAPIRFDLAWPLSSPIGFETNAQLYVGLKQAF